MKSYHLGRLAGLEFSAAPSAWAGLGLLWLVLTLLALWLARLPLGEALLAGLLATFLHWLSESVHQLGHAYAARQTGYPMIGVRYWGVFSTSIYPADEPALPAATHIRRALGGAPANWLLALAGGLLLLLLRGSSSVAWWVALFFFLDNLVVFGLGSFLPLGFNDGSTLLYWWGKR
jgi:hypothetical protein